MLIAPDALLENDVPERPEEIDALVMFTKPIEEARAIESPFPLS